MQRNDDKVLPVYFELSKLGVSLDSMTKDDWPLYSKIYSDQSLMKFITDVSSKRAIKVNFESLLRVQATGEPRYRTYRIVNEGTEMGILGLKWIAHGELQFGVILLDSFQKQGWSKRIKRSLIDYVYKHLNVSKMVAYCAVQNGAANHVNKSINMKLNKVIKKRTGQLINQWII